jgi:hypothetical protein
MSFTLHTCNTRARDYNLLLYHYFIIIETDINWCKIMFCSPQMCRNLSSNILYLWYQCKTVKEDFCWLFSCIKTFIVGSLFSVTTIKVKHNVWNFYIEDEQLKFIERNVNLFHLYSTSQISFMHEITCPNNKKQRNILIMILPYDTRLITM